MQETVIDDIAFNDGETFRDSNMKIEENNPTVLVPRNMFAKTIQGNFRQGHTRF